MKRKKIFRSAKLSRSVGGNMLVFLFLAIVAAFMALPVYYSVIQSLKPIEELFAFPPRFFVRNPTFSNYKWAFRLACSSWVPFSRYLANSVFISVAGTGIYVIIASLAGYPLAKTKIPGIGILSGLVVWTLLFSAEVTVIPRYIVISRLGMIDTYMAVLLPALAGSFGVFLMKQFMSDIPMELIESAKIDGANEFQIYWRVVMPLVKPAWLTLIILLFQQLWNNDGGTFIYSESIKPLSYALHQIVAGGIARTGTSSAVMLIMMSVPILVFILSQSQIIETMAHSGMK